MSLLISLSLAGTARFALMAGSNDGGPERVQLQYAVEDAEAMVRVFTQLGGVEPENTLLLTDPSPLELDSGLGSLRRAVAKAREAGDRTEVFVYYSGHSDEGGLRLAGEHYGYDQLRKGIEAIDSDVRVLVLDSCSSGAMVRSKGGSFSAPFLVDESVDVEGHAYLTSSAYDEVAQEADRIGGSYFTHYFITGLRGAADLSDDGVVTLNEAYHFAYTETLRGTERTVGGTQHANYDIQLSGTGDLVMTDVRATSASIVVTGEVSGRLSIRDEEQRLVAELLKPADRAIELGLSPGRYTLLLEQDGQLREAEIELEAGQSVELTPAQFSSVSALPTVSRGDDAPEEYTRVPVALGLAPAIVTSGGGKQLHVVDVGLIGTHAHALEGVQLSVGTNITRGPVRGLQATAGANIAADGLTGVQAAAGLNVAGGESTGVQASAGLNVAGDLKGVQLSDINVARSVRGAQFGVINIAGQANAQVGVINVARDANASVGLININLAGYNHVQVAASESDYLRVTGTYGGKTLYSLAEVGWRQVEVCPDCVSTRYTMLLGFGLHRPLGERLYLDADLAAGNYQYGFLTQEAGLLSRARVLVGYELNDHVAVFGGPTLSLVAADFGVEHGPTWVPKGTIGGLPAWFGVTGGVRF